MGLGRVRAFDRHLNMVLEEVKEVWTTEDRVGQGKRTSKPVHRDRFLGKMFLRGDSIIIVWICSRGKYMPTLPMTWQEAGIAPIKESSATHKVTGQ